MFTPYLPVIFWLAAIMALLYFVGMRANPESKAFHALQKCLCGMAVLLAWNLLAGPVGLGLGVNLVTCLTTGFLGVPGLGLLLALRWLV